jgi:hypothetical protein
MKDIIQAVDGSDLVIMDSVVAKAANVLSVQIGDLEYASAFGVDLRYFLQKDLQFQNETLKAHMVQKLIENQVNVAQVLDVIESLYLQYTFYVGEVKTQTEGLIL